MIWGLSAFLHPGYVITYDDAAKHFYEIYEQLNAEYMRLA